MVSDHLLERMQVLVESVNYHAAKHNDHGLFTTYHQLWLLLRELRGEISADGEETEEA